MQAESVSREDIVATFRPAKVGHFRSHVPGTSINESTLIAGDYLNHSTSSLMLLETIGAELTEFADDLMSWRPRTYEEHFSEAGFRDRNLAIAAYRRAPPRPLRRAVARLHDEALTIVGEVAGELGNRNTASTGPANMPPSACGC